MTDSHYCLAYLSRILPVISETFMVREIAALGARIKIFGIFPLEDQAGHPEAPELAQEVDILHQPSKPGFWLSHLFFFFQYPRRCWHCLSRYVLLASDSWRNRWRCLAFLPWRLMRPGAGSVPAKTPARPLRQRRGRCGDASCKTGRHGSLLAGPPDNHHHREHDYG